MLLGIVTAGVPFLLILAFGVKKYKELHRLYQYYQPSSGLHVTSLSKCDEHLMKCGFERIK